MKMRLGAFVVATLVLAVSLSSGSARAVAPFKAEFEAAYVKKESSDPQHKALAEAVAEAKCNVCHKGTSKKDFNAYGAALADLLDKKTDAQNKDKIREALAKVSEMKSEPNNPSAPTFGQLIEQGKLPGGK
jgi:uncharacterized membrane protein